jgi:hypothetical protein
MRWLERIYPLDIDRSSLYLPRILLTKLARTTLHYHVCTNTIQYTVPLDFSIVNYWVSHPYPPPNAVCTTNARTADEMGILVVHPTTANPNLRHLPMWHPLEQLTTVWDLRSTMTRDNLDRLKKIHLCYKLRLLTAIGVLY